MKASLIVQREISLTGDQESNQNNYFTNQVHNTLMHYALG